MSKMKKRVFRKRPEKRLTYTFHSYGAVYPFDPHRIVEDDRIVNEAGWFESMTMLDLHKAEVKMADAPHVFILDNMGNQLPV